MINSWWIVWCINTRDKGTFQRQQTCKWRMFEESQRQSAEFLKLRWMEVLLWFHLSKNLETTSLFSRRERGHFCKCSLKLKRHEPMFIYCPLGLIFQTTLLTTVPWTSSSPVSELQRTRCKGRLKDVPACENMTTIVELKINKATRFNWFTSDGRQPWPLTTVFYVGLLNDVLITSWLGFKRTC